MVEFNGEIRATGFGDRLCWAVYDPRMCRIQPPAKGNAPEKETVTNAIGYNFSPYFKPLQDGQ
ncbi:hypothetical protein J3R82DRAFT_7743 [Butyriboletus roseoflavus]|nr:hypothetical protein J3R82DRAFT_7743 [Butyriboletus roseoflavus]